MYTARKITHKYNTIEQTRFIRSFLFERKGILSIMAIGKISGLFKNELSDILYGETVSLNPESIQKLIPVLETVGFKMPVLSLTIEEIQRKICELSGLSLFVLKSKTTKRNVIEKRQIAIYLCKILTNEKNKFIAAQFNCSVSNVTQTINKVKGWHITNVHIRKKIDNYKCELTKFV
jgi:hypothetical protein